ncbi:hypothetical protein H6S82_09180 [Planktothrix sp. FACHB-1355]|uniref:Uncharacterized protein n=2 Tax=Cyanophyceae TaxID=3028117 RepID=A0A926VFM8_9CYAN|nr:hypothetical protein [Aerosakkonema funiforme FACHB-1375]MBD3559029.1 hypothetical protein [Planktothrix sp. FACHB-1355]
MKYINDPKIASDAAKSESTSAEDLELLASSQHIFVREAVAENPHTPANTLKALFPSSLETDNNVRIALAVVKNSVHGNEFLLTTASMVRSNLSLFEPRNCYPMMLIEAIASHPQVTIDKISPLLDPTSIPRHIRDRIARIAIQEELLIKLSQDPAQTVRSRATKRIAMLKTESL